MPESMPGWPISKKEIKEPVPSTNGGWGFGEVGGGSFLSVFLSLYVQPSVLSCSQTLSVNLVSTAKNPVRITNEDYWTESRGFPFVCACMSACVYVCMDAVCVRACVCHLFVEQKCPSVSSDRHLAMSHWP